MCCADRAIQITEAVQHLTKVLLANFPLTDLFSPPFDLLCFVQPTATFPPH